MDPEIDLDAYAFDLPESHIAQEPADARDAARLFVLERALGAQHHQHVRDLPAWLAAGDLLVVNATRVLPARLRGQKETGGHAEALLIAPADAEKRRYRAYVKCRGRLRAGQKFRFAAPGVGLDAEVVAIRADGEVVLHFAGDESPYRAGETPLPPYIRRSAAHASDAARYQTVYARVDGSVAAPTAGLHITPELLSTLRQQGVDYAEVLLHVGPGTFRPPRAEDLAARRLSAEFIALPEETARAIEATRARGGRVVAVGTTTTRVLESCADGHGGVVPREGETELLLAPGSRFSVVDALLTNFHLPKSTLLLLAAAFAGRETLLDAYREAVRRGYRFYSYGDAMLIC